MELLQNDNSVDYHRRIVAEALPELEQFIIIGQREVGSDKPSNFASCIYSEEALAEAVTGFLIRYQQALTPFLIGVNEACRYIEVNGNVD
ncbi:MAG: hypothetical protein HDS60_03645 [Barnesiella sp.]|nr:hypothetical protein [Barnesiella sp.]